MSSLLEQAIIDANALKEVAIKNAEQLVIEKYSPKIEEAVNSILEQDDELDLGLDDEMDLGGDEDLGDLDMGDMDMGIEDEGESDIAEQVPFAAVDGEEGMCPCAEEDEEIEIDFDELERQVAGEEDMGASEMTDREEVASEIVPDEDEFEDDEELELDEETLATFLEEELKVDVEPAKSGWAGTPPCEREEAEDMVLAKEQDTTDDEGMLPEVEPEEETDYRELYENLQKSHKKVQKDLKNAQNSNKTLKETGFKAKELLIKFESQMKELNTANARLVYINEVLGNTSLNERQKKQIVESISETKTAEEAKLTFKALQNITLEKPNNAPRSLKEAATAQKPKLPLLTSRRKEKRDEKETKTVSRLQKLAGIKK